MSDVAVSKGKPAGPAPRGPGVAESVNVFAHLKHLFQRRQVGFHELDGLRAILCLWMIAFHTMFYMHYFITAPELSELSSHPGMTWASLGFLPVDGFFALTGFLIAYPLFDKHLHGKTVPTVQSQFYRRIIRMTPVYYIGLIAFIASVWNGQIPVSQVRHELELDIIQKFNITTALPGGCDKGMPLANVVFLNNLVPFGGCQGYSWSLALQFQFYLVFPLLFAYFSKPGRSLRRAIVFAFVISIVWRFVSLWHLSKQNFNSLEGFFFSFWWYTNTLTRLSGLLIGVAAAYVALKPETMNFLRTRPWLQWTIWLWFCAALYAQGCWKHWFKHPGSEWGISMPGRQAVEAVRSTLTPLWVKIVNTIFYVFVMVGSPNNALFFAYLMVMSLLRIGASGKFLHSFLGSRFWYPIAQLSFWAYLLHPMVMMKGFSYMFPVSSAIGDYPRYLFIFYGVTFALAMVLYVSIERPIDVLLRSDVEPPKLSRIIYIFSIICLSLSVVAHILGHVFLMPVSTYPPADEVVAA